MNRKIVLCLSLIFMLTWFNAIVGLCAETRNIYIGDIITLEITGKTYSIDDIKKSFKDFDIVEIKETSSGFILSLRTFDVSEYKIPFEYKEVVIDVVSTLNDIQRDDIFDGDTRFIDSAYPFYWHILLYVAAGVCVLSGGYILVRTFVKKRIKRPNPLQLFLRRSSSLSAEDDNYFVDLTFVFKQYLEGLHKFRIIGKTSAEIMDELKRAGRLDVYLPKISEWLLECDRMKFSGVLVPGEKKHIHYRELIDLVKKIDTQKEETV